MLIETVEAETRPMLYVSRSTSMNPQDVAATMGEAFGAIGAFIDKSGVIPAGPPLAFYHDWDEGTGRMTVDVGFPVAPRDTTKATGDVHAGQTPSGKALKTVHHGPYPKLSETYGKIEAHMKKIGLPVPSAAWEVYVSEPGTPEDDLLTEIYMPVA